MLDGSFSTWWRPRLHPQELKVIPSISTLHTGAYRMLPSVGGCQGVRVSPEDVAVCTSMGEAESGDDEEGTCWSESPGRELISRAGTHWVGC
jgi:hypothetical protein